MRAPARLLVPVLGGLAVAAAIGAALVALQQALPRPVPDVRLASRALDVLQATPVAGAVVHLGAARPTPARCRSTSRLRLLVRVDGRRPFGFSLAPTLRAAAARVPVRRWAEVQLAGCRTLLADELAAAALRPDRGLAAEGRFGGRRVVRLAIGGFHGRTTLIMVHGTLVPLAVEFAARQVRGWSRLRVTR